MRFRFGSVKLLLSLSVALFFLFFSCATKRKKNPTFTDIQHKMGLAVNESLHLNRRPAARRGDGRFLRLCPTTQLCFHNNFVHFMEYRGFVFFFQCILFLISIRHRATISESMWNSIKVRGSNALQSLSPGHVLNRGLGTARFVSVGLIMNVSVFSLLISYAFPCMTAQEISAE